MPPVRWKILYVTMSILLQLWTRTDAQHMQDAISMTSDGWRPIVGSRRQPPAFTQDTRIPHYKNPSQKYEVEIVKSENPVAVSSTAAPNDFTGKPRESSTSSINNINAGSPHQHSQGGKIPVHTKFTSPGYHTLPPNSQGQQIPLGSVTQGRPSQFGFRKPPPAPPKRKPLRGPLGAHSNRNEVYVHAPATVNLPYLKPGPSNVKTRETQGLKLGGHHFSINQPNSHVEVNRFPHPPTNDNVFEQIKSLPVTYAFPNLKDEYTRNLVPPPPSRFLIEKEKLKAPKLPAKFKDNVATVSEPVLEFHDVGLQHFAVNSPQNNLVQLSVPFGQQFQLQNQFNHNDQGNVNQFTHNDQGNLNQFNHNDQGVNVEVTKEQLKVFHNNLPNRFNQKPQDYVDYFHSVTGPPQIPKLQTYEVTEGKWVDNPNPYTFKFQQTQDYPQKAKKPSGPARPLIPEPLVELNLPPFLPTPYRPPGARPTSSTQSEASTIFSQVSTKVNKYKGEVLTKNPLFFDLKEVSTHYPILGKPDFAPDSETDTPLAVGENGEISNEITTQRPKKRRRPQPRRPTTTVAPTTTTEEAATTENYDFRKQNFDSEGTERPYRRQRPVPNRINAGATGSGGYESEERHRTTTPSSVGQSEEGDGRRPLRYRTTPPPSDSDEGEVRKTQRYRTTPPPSDNDEGEVRKTHRYRTTPPPSDSDEREVRKTQRYRTTPPPSDNDEGEVRKTQRYRTTPPPSDNDEGEVRKTQRYRTATSSSDSDEGGRRKPLRYRTPSPPSNGDEGEVRKILRYRTTASPSGIDEGEEKRVRGRHRYRQRVPVGTKDADEPQYSSHRKRVRTTTEMPMNHKETDQESSSDISDGSTLAEEAEQSIEFKYSHNMDEEDTTVRPYRLDYEAPVRHHVTQVQEESHVRYETTPSDSEHMDKRAEGMIEEVIENDNTYDEVAVSSTTKESVMEINLPENEIEYSSPSAAPDQIEEEYIQTTLATTIPTTTTTEAQMTKPARTRGRPIKYHSSNRPRFSVKDYRQRLNQYTSTTPSTTTDFIKTTSEVTRVRFPNRLRTRPYHSTSTLPSHQEEESNTDQIQRRKFKPKDPRHSPPSSTTEVSEIITETNVKPVNTKLRPFGRYSNATRLKSSLFSNRRKALVSMKSKLFNKPTEPEETTVNNEEPTEIATLPITTPEEEAAPVETSTEFHSDKTNVVEATAEAVPPTVEGIIDEDDYSQRVSDLTSSFKSQYETPGFFKSVSPNSRRVPNYFTISTDDPILPIEAFFPNIKDKEQ